MDVANDRSLGFAGKDILFRKIEFERYRKPHVIEYPRSAIVLNPQHTRQLRHAISTHLQDGQHNAGDGDGDEGTPPLGLSDSDSDDDDPRYIDEATQLCSDVQLRSSLHLRWVSIAPVGLGLMNLGNTCFANCVLQAFAHIPALAQYFMSTFRSADNQLGAPFDFAFALADTFRKMQHASQQGRTGGGGGGVYRPGQIMGNVRLLSKHFSIGRQSDAHEFAVQLLFSCQKSLLHRLVGSKKVQPRVAHTTALHRICGGYLLSQVTWSRQEEIQQLLRIGKQQEAMDLKMEAKQAEGKRAHRASRHGLDVQTLYSNTYDPFTILSVELAGHTLLHCLDKFCAVEQLDGRSFLSPRQVGVRANKKLSIHVPPPVLAIHIKRFGPTGNKMNKHLQFPLELDITRYCTPLPSSSPPNHLQPHNGVSPPAIAKRPDCQYELNAVCVHEGRSIDYGHYYTLAKASNGMWYEFNDSHVSRLSEDQLQRAQVYMLFYSRKPTSDAEKRQLPRQQQHQQQHSTSGSAHAFASSSTDGLKLSMRPSVEEDSTVGRELSESEAQALLQNRSTLQRVAVARGNGDEENHVAKPSSLSSCDTLPLQTFKRLREAPPTDSDSSDDDETQEGAYARGMRGQLNGFAQQSSHSEADAASQPPRRGDEDGAVADEEAPLKSVKASLYGGLIKSMKRVPKDGTNGSAVADTTAPPQQRPGPNFRVGRHAVHALHQRKALNTPETVRRPASAPKFQQRIRDPMWEMEMDRGKVKKIKSKEKMLDPFEGVNPFQEVSRGLFDARGRRRRE